MINEKKPRLLLVFEMLQKTYVENPLNTTEIIDNLKKCGVNAERKAVFRDLKALQTVGYKIIWCSNHNRGYYMITHLFEMHELKIIADLIADANFLTAQASTSILQKIQLLCPASTERILKEGIYISESNKVETESELEKIKTLLCAITESKMVSLHMIMPRQFNGEFFYGNGHKKEISPYYLLLDSGKYILLGYDENSGKLERFEVALINKLMLLDKPAKLKIYPYKRGYDAKWYMDMSKDSYSSVTETVALLCDNIVKQEVKRKFGNESLPLERPFNRFMIYINITDRTDFFEWLIQMDSKVKILRTKELQIQFVEYVRQRYTEYLEQYGL